MEKDLQLRVVQSIMGEHFFQACSEHMGREDEMYTRLGQLAELGLVDTQDVDPLLQLYREQYNG